jgi:hypothetical protein
MSFLGSLEARLVPPPYRRMLRNPHLLVAFALFVGQRIAQGLGVGTRFTASYLDPLLALPLSLSLALFIVRRWVLRRPGYVVGVQSIVFAWALFSVVFEYLLPPEDPRMTADAWDVLAYALGGLWFHLGINRPD